MNQKELTSGGVEPFPRKSLTHMRVVSVELISVRHSLLEVLQEIHQEVHVVPTLSFLVLQLVNGSLDVL